MELALAEIGKIVGGVRELTLGHVIYEALFKIIRFKILDFKIKTV